MNTVLSANEVEDLKEKAGQYLDEGYTCSQSVFKVFQDYCPDLRTYFPRVCRGAESKPKNSSPKYLKTKRTKIGFTNEAKPPPDKSYFPAPKNPVIR